MKKFAFTNNILIVCLIINSFTHVLQKAYVFNTANSGSYIESIIVLLQYFNL